MTFQDITPILLAIVAALPGLLALRSQKRKDVIANDTSAVDNAKKIADQAILLLTPYNDKFIDMEKDIKELKENSKIQDKKIEEQDDIIKQQAIQLADQEKQLKKFKLGIKKLIDQIIKLGHVPDWEPEGE